MCQILIFGKQFFEKKHRNWIYICFLTLDIVSTNPTGDFNCLICLKKTNLSYQDLNRGPPAHESNTLPLSYGSNLQKGQNLKYLNDFKFFHLSQYP